MGIVYRSIPLKLALRLQQQYHLEDFVETGTLRGDAAIWASQHFRQVFTIELTEKFYQQAKVRCAHLNNVELFHGSSQMLLASILENLQGSALIWLDAHWSRDLGVTSPFVPCPVLHELAILTRFAEAKHVILIDDVRLFGRELDWPTLKSVETAAKFAGRTVYIEDDVLVSTP